MWPNPWRSGWLNWQWLMIFYGKFMGLQGYTPHTFIYQCKCYLGHAITSLSVQSWQYRDKNKRKPKVETMPHSYRMTLRVLYSSTIDSTTHSRQLWTLYMHNFDNKHLTRPGFETQPDLISHRDRLYCGWCCSGVYIKHKWNKTYQSISHANQLASNYVAWRARPISFMAGSRPRCLVTWLSCLCYWGRWIIFWAKS